MNVKILYDNEALPGFKSGWGFSALIDDSTLFDTGENPVALLDNLHRFNLDPSCIKRIVLSHDDWDHVDGIPIIRQCGPVTVYLPSRASRALTDDIGALNPSATIVRVRRRMEIAPGLMVTDELGWRKKEISLTARGDNGQVLVTGCAHPGLARILKHVRSFGNVQAVVGGFHDFRKLAALKDIPVIVPCHCTRKKKELGERFPRQTRFVRAGSELLL